MKKNKIKLLFIILFTIAIVISCEKTTEPIDTGGSIIVNNRLVMGSKTVDIDVHIDDTNHGVVGYNNQDTYSVNEGWHKLKVSAHPGQGAIYGASIDFKCPNGAVLSVTVDLSGIHQN